ncbi:MAG: TolC family outer membrane protein [Sulfuricurvum sp.]|nr:TolC family outer membrane protein [Sulfuricurvum sp.]
MRRIVVNIAIICIWVHSVSAIDLRTIVYEAVETNPDIMMKRKELAAAREDLKLARSGYYPKIDVEASVGRETTTRQLTATQNNRYNTLNTSASLKQNLFAGFATDNEITQKENKIKARQYALMEQANEIALTTTKAYLDTLKAYERLEIELDNVKSHEKFYNDITTKLEAGAARGSDYAEVTSKLSLAYSNLLVQDNAYHDALSNFHKLAGRYEEGQNLTRPERVSGIPKKLEEALTQALQYNPSLMVGRYELEATKALIRQDQGKYYPKLDATLNARTAQNASGLSGTTESTSALLTLSWNLYNGGNDSVQMMKSVTETEKSIESLYALQRTVMEKMGLAYNAYYSMNRQSPFLALYKDTNAQKVSFYYDEFNLGRRSLIDLLNAESEYNSARHKWVQNEYDLLLAEFRVLNAKGSLLKYLDISLNGEFARQTNRYTLEEDEVEKEHQSVICQNTANANFGINGCSIVPKPQEYRFLDTPPSLSPKGVKAPSEDSAVTDNARLAFEWYAKGANQGDLQSMEVLSQMYSLGIGVAQDRIQGEYWKKASMETLRVVDRNDSQYDEAMAYTRSDRSGQSKKKGYRLLLKMARSGHVKAQFALGQMYASGTGIPKNRHKGAIWYRQAARNGYEPAYPIVAQRYRKKHDHRRAEYWEQKAAESAKTEKSEPSKDRENLSCGQECIQVLSNAKRLQREGAFESVRERVEKLSLAGNGEASRLIAESYYPREQIRTPLHTIPEIDPTRAAEDSRHTDTKNIPDEVPKIPESIKSLDERLRELGIVIRNETIGGKPMLKAPPSLVTKSRNDHAKEFDDVRK